jgi:MFS transporter, DHA1 family, multidrug resistance protein
MRARFLKNAIVLGLVSAIGPFAIDMYLPALPSIGRSLHADPAAVQMSLSAFFIALAIGPPICGPLSDRFGRKPPLYVGLALFVLASLGCALAPNIGTLIAFRFIEGLAACAGMVIPRAIVRDLHTGADATKLMSLLMLVFSVSPILAPLTGSFVIQVAGWRAVFWTVTAAALVGAVILSAVPETRPKSLRAAGATLSAFASYKRLLTDRTFLGVTLIGAFGLASFFVYLSNSPFVLIEHYHLSPRLFSVLFSTNAASFFAVAQLNGWLAGRIGLRHLVRRAATGYAVVLTLLFVLTLSGVDRLDVLVILLFIGYGFLGMVLPTAAVLALEHHGSIAGTASAVMGTLQFAMGSAVMMLVGNFANATPLPMVSGIAGCALAALTLARATLRVTHDSRAQPATDA